MNILHMKYAVEVARVGSLSRAAERLFIAQPNISRSIKELEADLGITIFNRSARGMVLTPEGEEFIGYATEILKQIEQVEVHYGRGTPNKQRFSLSAPSACYISEAFARFSATVGAAPSELFCKETDSSTTVQGVLDNEYRLGIVRYAENYDGFFKSMLEEKGLYYEMVAEFRYCLAMSGDSPLAGKDTVGAEELSDCMEVVGNDPRAASLSHFEAFKTGASACIDKRIFVSDRASRLELLSANKNSFAWVSPIPRKTLERYGLVQRQCGESGTLYKDVLIYRDGYRLTALDRRFITELCISKRECF